VCARIGRFGARGYTGTFRANRETDLDEAETLSEEPILGLIPIHFDVPGHYLPLATFVDTANQARAAIDALNRELFEGELEFEFYILPPEEGSFKTTLAVVLATVAAISHFAETSYGKALIKGLTGQEPAYWAEQAGALVRQQVAEALHESAVVEKEAETLRSRQQFETTIITESTKSFFQKDVADLRCIGITPLKFRDAFEARNKFYEACLHDAEVHALGFDETEKFPIKRRDFAALQVKLPPKETEPDESWDVEISLLKVSSPNWVRTDRQRQWKARDHNGHPRYFLIDDEHFWHLVRTQAISPLIIDTIKVQWAYVGEQRRKAKVLKVLEYNGDPLGEPLDDNALRAILGKYNRRRDLGPDLFSR
jgi:hypothetical protein